MLSRLKKSPVIEDHFVEIVVGMEERHLERAGIALDRPRHEGADDEAVGHEGRMHRGRQ
jgi:hypothetical protein